MVSIPFTLFRSDRSRHTVLGGLVRVVIRLHAHSSRQRPARLQAPRAAAPDALKRTLKTNTSIYLELAK